MASELSVNIAEGPGVGVKTAALTGEMDESNLESLRAKMEPVLGDTSVKTLVFDMAGLSFINSKGIGYLVSVHTHLAKDGRRLVLAAAQEAVMDVINLVGLTSIIPYADTAEQVSAL